ncbi:hypothetical protein EYC84_000939 [Monilinia fructicola]|uniref:Uncharacterized protein n=1 Tax=Monilinia fructicola TaxID=38448 RepID=A0A5M9JIF4_MONFR|nr:hypothetical protein EYC84_000939 [Monilinia fructicola]
MHILMGSFLCRMQKLSNYRRHCHHSLPRIDAFVFKTTPSSHLCPIFFSTLHLQAFEIKIIAFEQPHF